jgi:hypothetical protein
VIGDVIQSLKDRGLPEKKDLTQISFRVNHYYAELLDEIVALTGSSRAAIAREVLRRVLREYEATLYEAAP